MQKVVYLVSKVNKDKKLKGVGYLVEGNLLIPSTSSKGNRIAKARKMEVEHLEVNEGSAERVQALCIDRVPTLIVFRDGEEVARCTGYQPEEILELWLDAKTE